ncbi:MAG TPA: dTMP kinase [Candidatus Paceibacterota bacterium]|nr:dTMP kinase [Candidatus Paceibacterota bacterium]
MTQTKGKFFVLEGIDGSGGETQRKRLADRFRENSIPAEVLKYPDYSGPIGNLIHEYLYNKYDFSKEVQVLLYTADFLKDKQKIEQWKEEGKVIIADRYFLSTLAFQCLHDVPIENALEIAKLLKLPVPDLILLLDTPVKTSMERKNKEKSGNLDRHESNEAFLGEVADLYRHLAENNVFAPWKVIDGEQPIEQVTDSIWQAISPQLD